MEKKLKLVAVVMLGLLTVISLRAWADNTESKHLLVEIDYGGVVPSRTVEAPTIKGRTVLEVLETVAEVETHPVGEYVFVTGIDGVYGKRGETAWYYTVDGESADRLAYSKVVNDGIKHIRWRYEQDVCSEKVDGKK